VRQPKGETVLGPGTLYLVSLLVVAFIIGVYWTVRFAGYSGEGDTTRITHNASAVYETGQLTTTEVAAYQSGFGFPAILAIVSQVTNIPIRDLQLNGGLWLPIFAAAAFICYRELLRSNAAAALGVLLLLLMPDFVFYILRGSHEKVTWMLTLILVYLLLRSYRLQTVGGFALNTILFYFVFWNLASTHVFFASTLLTALAISYFVGFILIRFRGRRVYAANAGKRHNSAAFSNGLGELAPASYVQDLLRIGRLALVSLSCFIIVYLILNFVYPPAQNYYNNLEFVAQRIQSLFLGGGTAVYAPDTPTGLSALGFEPQLWRSRDTYLMVTVIQWLIILGSIISWFVLGWKLLKQPHFSSQMFLWLWYSAMAIQLVLAVISSLQSLLFFNNLSVRVFTPFALTAAPMAALLLYRVLQSVARLPRPLPLFARLTAYVVLTFGAIVMLLKVTTDPLIGNLWQFTLPGELSAVDWIEEHAHNRYVHMDIWTLRNEIYQLNQPYNWEPNNVYYTSSAESYDDYDYLLRSALTTAQAQRAQGVLPLLDDYSLVYDSGQAQVYGRRPDTPFQN
jgi:hypothetical protein